MKRSILLTTIMIFFCTSHVTIYAQNVSSKKLPDYKIVFMKTAGMKDNIYMMDRSGSNEVQLTCAGGTNPVVSYNGKVMAYRKGNYSNYRNLLIDFESGKIENILDSKAEVYSISPDGKKILYTRYADAEKYIEKELYIANIDGSDETKLVSGGDVWEAIFSPAEDKVAYVKQGNIFVIDLNTKKTIQLTKDEICDGISWSGDGNTIIYCGQNYEVISIEKDGTNKKVIFKDKAILVDNPSLSPDGTQIVFNNLVDGQMYSIKSDGTDLTKLTDIQVTENAVWLKVDPDLNYVIERE
ncbi:MAG: protein tolB [Clostridia bacterium]|uniref:TolB family protein n=1 Tax=Petroclostridium xylanilyticum TaxID=1792311 RepID=UPI000B99B85B|nr:DPP IV N-terminal domain-containing protein [Petroclostridium xylanilyticum]MBZ4647375.1 protein tolB [Clostridia bacterium]